MDQAGGPSKTPSKLKETQAQVDEVVGIMRVNVEKVLERDQKLTDLHDRADALQHGASQFEHSATRLKRNMWLKNMKMWLVMGGIFAALILIIIIWALSSGSDSEKGSN